MQIKNLLVNNFSKTATFDEIFENIFVNEKIKIERIISNGQASPENFWYDQKESEFVVLLKGHAKVEFIDSLERIATYELLPYDYFLINPHEKHRVASTSLDEETVWLTIYF